MQTTTIRAKQGTAPDRVAGDRRRDRRYPVRLELSWKLIRRGQVLNAGVGVTLDISSGGILFDANRSLSLGADIELAVAWPVRLHDVTPLQLVVQGRVKRCYSRLVAVETAHQQFRTVKAPSVTRSTAQLPRARANVGRKL